MSVKEETSSVKLSESKDNSKENGKKECRGIGHNCPCKDCKTPARISLQSDVKLEEVIPKYTDNHSLKSSIKPVSIKSISVKLEETSSSEKENVGESKQNIAETDSHITESKLNEDQIKSVQIDSDVTKTQSEGKILNSEASELKDSSEVLLKSSNPALETNKVISESNSLKLKSDIIESKKSSNIEDTEVVSKSSSLVPQQIEVKSDSVNLKSKSEIPESNHSVSHHSPDIVLKSSSVSPQHKAKSEVIESTKLEIEAPRSKHSLISGSFASKASAVKVKFSDLGTIISLNSYSGTKSISTELEYSPYIKEMLPELCEPSSVSETVSVKSAGLQTDPYTPRSKPMEKYCLGGTEGRLPCCCKNCKRKAPPTDSEVVKLESILDTKSDVTKAELTLSGEPEHISEDLKSKSAILDSNVAVKSDFESKSRTSEKSERETLTIESAIISGDTKLKSTILDSNVTMESDLKSKSRTLEKSESEVPAVEPKTTGDGDPKPSILDSNVTVKSSIAPISRASKTSESETYVAEKSAVTSSNIIESKSKVSKDIETTEDLKSKSKILDSVLTAKSEDALSKSGTLENFKSEVIESEKSIEVEKDTSRSKEPSVQGEPESLQIKSGDYKSESETLKSIQSENMKGGLVSKSSELKSKSSLKSKLTIEESKQVNIDLEGSTSGTESSDVVRLKRHSEDKEDASICTCPPEEEKSNIETLDSELKPKDQLAPDLLLSAGVSSVKSGDSKYKSKYSAEAIQDDLSKPETSLEATAVESKSEEISSKLKSDESSKPEANGKPLPTGTKTKSKDLPSNINISKPRGSYNQSKSKDIRSKYSIRIEQRVIRPKLAGHLYEICQAPCSARAGNTSRNKLQHFPTKKSSQERSRSRELSHSNIKSKTDSPLQSFHYESHKTEKITKKQGKGRPNKENVCPLSTRINNHRVCQCTDNACKKVHFNRNVTLRDKMSKRANHLAETHCSFQDETHTTHEYSDSNIKETLTKNSTTKAELLNLEFQSLKLQSEALEIESDAMKTKSEDLRKMSEKLKAKSDAIQSELKSMGLDADKT